MDMSDFFKELNSEGRQQALPPIIDVEAIWNAVERPRLTDLKPGEVLKQIRWGLDYRYNCDDQPVVFVRYRNERDSVSQSDSSVWEDTDIIIAKGICQENGKVLTFLVDSTHYERIEKK